MAFRQGSTLRRAVVRTSPPQSAQVGTYSSILVEENQAAEKLTFLKILLTKMECKICLHSYVQTQRRPRVLPCGHTFCDKCVERLLTDGSLVCPTCRVKHSASVPSQFPFSFELEELLQEISTAKPQKSEHTLASEGLSQMMTSLLQKQMSAASKGASDCKDMLQQLQIYEAYLDELVKDQEDCLTKFADMVEHHKSILMCQRKKATLLRETGLNHEQELKTALKALETATSTREFVDELDKTDKMVAEVQDWAEKSQLTLLDTSVIYKSAKTHAAMMEGLELISQVLKDGTDFLVNPKGVSEKCNVQEVLRKARTPVTMSGLWKMTAPVRQLVEAGQVVAVQMKDNRPRYSRITMDKDTVCMHHLQTGCPEKPFTYVVPHHKLKDWTGTDTLTFLDVSWSGVPRRRVYIRVNPEENNVLAEQFVLMCTAEKGPSFAGTFLSRLKDSPFMLGGDYDKTGGKAIVSGISKNKSVQCKEGMVSGYWLGNEDPGTRFTIFTKNWSNFFNRCSPFGEVVEGIKFLDRTPKKYPITLVDCGIVVKEEEDLLWSPLNK